MLNPSGTVAGGAWFLARAELQRLLDLLREDGRKLIGPTVRDHAIVNDEIEDVDALPRGVGDEQAPGRYRLVRRTDERVFGYVVGPTSWKQYTYPSRVKTIQSRYGEDLKTVEFRPVVPEVPRVAFLGVRACELAALRIHDRVFLGGPFVETDYQMRRRAAVIVAVQCTTSASTCFCTAMKSGPDVKAGAGHDLALTELDDGFVLEAGTPTGSELLARLPVTAATMDQAVAAVQAVAANRTRIGMPLATAGLRDRLLAQMDHPRWSDVGSRCISCGNCTSVCPTCFCTSVERTTDLAAKQAVSERVWDSCFSPGLHEGGRRRFAPADQAPLPAVAHAQVRVVVGPVRLVGLHRLRALRHVLPGGHRRARGDRRHRPGHAEADRRRSSSRSRTTVRRTPRRASWASAPRRPTRRRCVLAGLDAAHVDGGPGPVRDGRAARSPGRGDLGLALPAARTVSSSRSAPPVRRRRRSPRCRSGAIVGHSRPRGPGLAGRGGLRQATSWSSPAAPGSRPLRPLLDRADRASASASAPCGSTTARATADDMLFARRARAWDRERSASR